MAPYYLNRDAQALLEARLRAFLKRECLCADQPFYPTEQQYNPDCPCHEEVP